MKFFLKTKKNIRYTDYGSNMDQHKLKTFSWVRRVEDTTLKQENYHEKAENVTNGFNDDHIVDVGYGGYVGGKKPRQQQSS